MIWRFMLGRLLLLPMLSISSSASVVELLHSQGGGGDIVQSHGVELAGGLVGLGLLKALWCKRRYPPEASSTRNRTLLERKHAFVLLFPYPLSLHVISQINVIFRQMTFEFIDAYWMSDLWSVSSTPAPQLCPFLKHSSQSRLNVDITSHFLWACYVFLWYQLEVSETYCPGTTPGQFHIKCRGTCSIESASHRSPAPTAIPRFLCPPFTIFKTAFASRQ